MAWQRGGEWTMNAHYGPDSDGWCCLGTFWIAGEHDARAVAWLRNHADALLAAAARADALARENAALRHRIALIREEAERLIELGRNHPANAGGYATNILWHCRRVVLAPREGDDNGR